MNCNSSEFRAFFKSGDVICIWIHKFVFQAVKWEYSHITRSVVKEGVTKKRVMPVSLVIRVWFEDNPNVSRVQFGYDLSFLFKATRKEKLCAWSGRIRLGVENRIVSVLKSLVKLLLFSRIRMMAFFYRSAGIFFGLPSGVSWLCGRSGMNKYVCLVLPRLQFESFTMKKPGTRGPVGWNDSLNKQSLVSLNVKREGALSF